MRSRTRVPRCDDVRIVSYFAFLPVSIRITDESGQDFIDSRWWERVTIKQKYMYRDKHDTEPGFWNVEFVD